MFNSNLLKYEIMENGYTLQDFSSKVGIKRTALYRKLRGITEFNCSEISNIISTLNLSPEKTIAIFFS